jgi:capsular polysaccharide transport system ATP-binding protein
MITVRDVYKSYPTRSGPKVVLQDVNFDVYPGEKLGILGRNGAGKSTIIRLLSGVENPTRGSIDRQMSVSWPLAFGGAFQTSLTGLDNLRFICRVYGVEPEPKIQFVQEFSELGRYLREPVGSYSSGMLARLAFAISMTIEFDCFLVDEIIAVGDQRFHDKCHIELFEKRADRSMIFVSHDINYIQAHCQRAAVLNEATLTMFDNVPEAYEFYLSR